MNPYEAPLPLPYIIRDNRITYLSFGSFFKKWWKPIVGITAAIAVSFVAPWISAAILKSTFVSAAVAGATAGFSAATTAAITTGLGYAAAAAVGAGLNVAAQAAISGGFAGWKSAAIGGAFAGIAGQFAQTGGFEGMFGTTGGPGTAATSEVASITGNSGVPSLTGSIGTAATGRVDTLVATSAPSAGVPGAIVRPAIDTSSVSGLNLGNVAPSTAPLGVQLGTSNPSNLLPPSVLNPPPVSMTTKLGTRPLPPGFVRNSLASGAQPAAPPTALGTPNPNNLLRPQADNYYSTDLTTLNPYRESNFFANVATDLGERWKQFDATGALINAGLTTAGNIAASALTGPSPEQEEYLRQQAAAVASLKKQQDARREFLIQQARRGPGILPGQSAAAAAGAYRASRQAGIRRLDPNARAAAQRHADRIASQKGQTQHAQALLYNQRASQAAAGLWPAATSVADKITGLSKAQEAIDAKQQADTDNLASTFATWMTPTPKDEDDEKDRP